MAEVKLERDSLSSDINEEPECRHIKEEPECRHIKEEPGEFPFSIMTVKTEEAEQDHVDEPEEDTDDSEDYSHHQAPEAKRSYAMIPSDHRPFRCSECGKSYVSERSLVSHNNLHLRQPRDCPVCNKFFSSLVKLKKHMVSHTSSFRCSVCDKGCGTEQGLKQHMKAHAEKPFSCPYCKKAFVRQRNLTGHQEKVHFICRLCSEGFHDNTTMKQHLRKHDWSEVHAYLNPFSCSVCGKRSQTEQGLKIHLKVHSEERPFQCSVCQKQLKHEMSLIRHKRIYNH